MAWSEVIYSFLSTTAVSPGFIFSFDVNITENNPGIQFNGTEANAVYTVIREIAGDFWIVQNAEWNGTNWIPKNLSAPVAALVLRSPSSVGQPSYMQRLTAAAGVNPVVWVTQFQVTGTGLVTSNGQQTGTATGQLADGSLNTVTYTGFGGFTFPTATDFVFASVVTGDTNYDFGAIKIATKSASGFQFTLPGGPNGQTVSIDYLAIGH